MKIAKLVLASLIGVIAVSALALALTGGTPYYTLHQMQQAVKEGDADALLQGVDVSSVRRQFIAQMTANAMNDGNGFGMLAVVMADKLLTEEVIAGIVQAGIERAAKEGRTAAYDQDWGQIFSESDLTWDSMTTARLMKTETGEGIKFQRTGLMQWQIVGVVGLDLSDGKDTQA